MNPNTIREMEPHTRQRFHFAASSFSRMYGVDKVTSDMLQLCIDWAKQSIPPPLEGLNEVDVYFRNLWNLKLQD